jgi:hypothetical protein
MWNRYIKTETEEYPLLGSNGRNLPMFRWNILPPSSRTNKKSSKKPSKTVSEHLTSNETARVITIRETRKVKKAYFEYMSYSTFFRPMKLKISASRRISIIAHEFPDFLSF